MKTQSYNPATGKKFASFDGHTQKQLIKMIEDARAAQPAWRDTPLVERVKKIRKVQDYLVQHLKEISFTISQDNGKTELEAFATEVMPAVMATSYYCKMSKKFLKEKKVSSGNLLLFNKKSVLRREPFGVMGIISPWNYPFSIPYSEVIMALLAGNAVVLKVATETQATGHALKKAIEAAGLPEYIFQYANISGSIAGDTMIDAKVDKLFFTGSTDTGKYLMEKAAKHLIPLSLELGGNDPMIVCHDANIDRAVAGALWAGFQNAGQSCGGVERIYVHQSVYAEFVEKLGEKIKNTEIVCGQNHDAQMGVMTTAKQKEKVMQHVNDAVKRGAQIFAESSIGQDVAKSKNACKAYVLTKVDHQMLVMQEETFGPVVGIMPFETEEEVLSLANDSTLGLTASVWSKDRKRAKLIAKKIKSGAVTINDHLMSHGMAETPWGGFKESGLGRTHGVLGFDEMTQPQILVDDFLSFTQKNVWWHPYNKEVYEGIIAGVYVLYNKNFLVKFTSLFKLTKVFLRVFKK